MTDVSVRMVLDWLNALAPFQSAESFDNVGLLLGDPDAAVRNVLFGMDLDAGMLCQAMALHAELIVTHHPFIFSPLRRIDYTSPQGQALCALAGKHVNVIAAHTNWDKAPGGVSDALAKALGLCDVTRGDEYLRVGTLAVPLRPGVLAAHIEQALGFSPRRYGNSERLITRVAVAGGAYGEGAALAHALGAEAYVVGEIHHHELLDACARGLTVYDSGHFATEAPGVRALYERFLADAAQAVWQVTPHLYPTAPFAGAMLGNEH
ncbi:MAG: Nif3-like dinuclear metal center hexameric protein [Clostridia bacterium]